MRATARTVRSLARRPAYSGLMLALLTLATTATSVTFAVVRATLWRDLPYHDPSALTNIFTTEPVNKDSAQQLAASAMMLAHWRAASRTLSGVEAQTPVSLSVGGPDDPEALSGAAVSAGLFELLGTPPVVGRSFRREEEVATSGVIIIGDAVARRRFGGRSVALGKTLIIDGDPRVVVGVMAPGYSLLFQGGDAWIPLDLSPQQQQRVGVRNIATYGRLRPGSSLDQARAELAAIQRTLAATVPEMYAATLVSARPLREALFGDRRPTMFVLVVAVALVLLIAVVNVANLTLADALSRRTSTMVRVALGARAAELVAVRVGEVSVLAALSFAAAVMLCVPVLAILATISPEPFVPLGNRWLDATIVLAAFVTAMALAIGSALPAAIVEARTRATGIAGTVARAGDGADRRLQLLLGAAQSMVTVVLLGVALLLGRDLARLLAVQTGLTPERVVVVRMNALSRERTTIPSRAQYAEALVRSIGAVPGVIDVSAIQSRFVLNETMQSVVDIDGVVATPGQRLFTQIRHVMPDVFRVLGVRVVSGRGLDSTDRADARPVAVVSVSFANRFWPGEAAVGKRVRRGSPGAAWLEVVGVVEDVMDAGLGVPVGPTLYVPYLQQNTATARVTLVARVRGSSPGLIAGIRQAVWTVNPSQAIDDVTPLGTLMARSAAQPRFRAAVVAVFGCSAVALVLAGVYATTLLNVLSRRRELGVRGALGASPASLVMLATRSSLAPVLLGGLGGALLTVPVVSLTSRIIQSDMRSGDALLSFAAVVVLLGVAAAAALVPARRAAHVSPAEAMRGG